MEYKQIIDDHANKIIELEDRNEENEMILEDKDRVYNMLLSNLSSLRNEAVLLRDELE